MLLTYHAKLGSEAELQRVLASAWDIYRADNLVCEEPHVLFRRPEGRTKSCFVEILSWVSHAAPDHPPANVAAIWQQEQSLCESRGGRPGIDGSEVDLLLPAAR